MESKNTFVTFLIFTLAIILSLIYPFAVIASDLPKTVGIATHSVGGAYHASGSGVASLISQKTTIRAVVQPHSGPSAWVPIMQSGEVEMGILSAFDAACAYKGVYGYKQPYTKLRTVCRGNEMKSTTLTVLENSNIKKITSLKGKKVASVYGGNKFLHNLTEAMLSSAGMKWDDVVAVPVPGFRDSLRLLREGRIDAGSTGAPTTPAAVELDTAKGVYVLAFGDMEPKDIKDGTPSGKKSILEKMVPGCYLSVAKGGVGTVDKDTVLITSPVFFAASSDMSTDAVYTILKALWKDYKMLHSAHPWLKQWKPETMAASNQPAPYHPGAVKFYKEIGKWTPEMEKQQVSLLEK
jgi:TRAP transporter TAXI family solute receptor